MRSLTLFFTAAMLTAPASAQTTVRVTGGATRGSSLVSDPVLHADRTVVQPAIAPSLSIAVIPNSSARFRVIFEATAGTSHLNVSDSITHANLGTLNWVDLLIMADGPVRWGVRWQLGGGALLYRPSERQGIFLDDAPRRWLIGGGASWSRQLTPKLTFVAVARYDFHDFITKTMQFRGFEQTQSVHRFGLFAGVERTF